MNLVTDTVMTDAYLLIAIYTTFPSSTEKPEKVKGKRLKLNKQERKVMGM